MMTEAEFEAALDRWGSDLSHWPEAAASGARRHLSRDPAARRALSAARAVDEHLAELRALGPEPAGLRQRIRSALPGTPQRNVDVVERALRWLLERPWRPALLALVPAALGFALGALFAPAPATELGDRLSALAFSDLYQEADDVSE